MTKAELIELRVRSRASDESIERVKGRILGPDAIGVLLRRPTRVVNERGRLLCIHLPGVLADAATEHFESLAGIRGHSKQRNLAGGAGQFRMGRFNVAKQIPSVPLGFLEAYAGGRHEMMGIRKQCRLTAWTGQNIDAFRDLYPYFRAIARYAEAYTPEHVARQMTHVRRTPPQYIITGTPFTTVTINNTFATGVHTDKGDLDDGISCLTFATRGRYDGGELVFPQYGIAIPARHGDLCLMDAHQWHGNVDLANQSDDAVRVSTVLYFRTKVEHCPATGEALIADA